MLPKKWLMKSLVWQHNRHQKVYGGLCLCAVGGGLSIGGLCICAVGLDILKFEETSLFYSASYFNLGGAWRFVSEGLRPPKPPTGDGTVWQDFSFLFNAIDSEKYRLRDMSSLQAMSSFLFISMTGPKVAQRIQVVSLFCFMKQTCAGTILPSFEGNWLK